MRTTSLAREFEPRSGIATRCAIAVSAVVAACGGSVLHADAGAPLDAGGEIDAGSAPIGEAEPPVDAGLDVSSEQTGDLDALVEGGLQCSWSAVFVDSGPGYCHAARSFVTCLYSSSGCGCLSPDPTTCAGCAPGNGRACHDDCALSEYALECGGLPGRPAPPAGATGADPPAACHFNSADPGGHSFFCCPCE